MNAKRGTSSDSELSLCFTVLLYYCHSNYYRERLTADGINISFESNHAAELLLLNNV